jgi:type I restriction enzyme S subunit
MKSKWTYRPLGELVSFASGGTPSKKRDGYWGGTIPWISAKTLKTENIDTSDLFITEEGLKAGSKIAPKGSILLLTRGSGLFNGIPIARVEKDVAFNQDIKCLDSYGEVENEFIFYWLLSQKDYLMAKVGVTGIGAGKFDLDFLQKLMIPIPSERERKSIVGFANSISEKIRCNAKVNDNLLEQMQALYKSWFVDYRPFGGVMPTSWTQTGIYSLANIIYGAPFASKQFNTEGNGRPIIRIRDLKDQQFATYTTEVHPKGYLLHPGDIVVGMDGEFRPYIWGNDEAWLNQRVCVFENKRPNGKAFLYFTIKPLLFAIEQTQVATTVIHIGKKDFDAFEIMLPDTELLDAFDVITTPMVEQIVSNSIENKRLAIMRDALLPKLMSGEINVSNIQL